MENKKLQLVLGTDRKVIEVEQVGQPSSKNFVATYWEEKWCKKVFHSSKDGKLWKTF